jgi:hypothetical protein
MTTRDLPSLDYYAELAPMTDPGPYAPMFAALPNDVGALARVIQGLAVHEYAALDFYGFRVPEARKDESHIRSVEHMVDRLLAIEDQPLDVSRPVEKRLVGVCHHHMLFLVAMLRAHGIPARARCGFGTYFNPGYSEDHWLCEFWSAPDGRWRFVDPQFDEAWRGGLHIDHDVLDVPRDRFLVAADAWKRCRDGDADPSKFGIFKGDLRGLWFIAGNLVHDLAALNKVEMLPWDAWGAFPKPNEALGRDQLAYFDRLAALTKDPDERFDDVREVYDADAGLKVPARVFNSIRQRMERVFPDS